MNGPALQRTSCRSGNSSDRRDGHLGAILLILTFLALPTALTAQGVEHLKIAQPGGMPGLPIMTGIERRTNGVALTWDGPQGAYQIFQRTNLQKGSWQAVGGKTNFNRTGTVTKLTSSAFFKVSGPSPKYAGDVTCRACHLNVCRYETNTPHASAYSNPWFKAAGGQTNSSCLACHTVGYGLPTGFYFTNRNGHFSYTTNLAGVQCENCHGPAANHAANENDPTLRPRVELAATMCGGCHTDTHEDWQMSGHSAVTSHALQSMTRSTASISSCGRCHSGSARLALIAGKNPSTTLTNDFDMAITCAVCHNPHQTNSAPAQLRNPLSSTNYFYLATSDNFTNKYNANANVNLCGQCHNHRGAAWQTSDRAPHRSAQYNFLLGDIGELPGLSLSNNPAPGSHAGLPSSALYSLSGTFYLTNQCVACHMQQKASPETGHSHTFKMDSYNVCMNCHPFAPQKLVDIVMKPAVSNRVYALKYYLDSWGTTASPSGIRPLGAAAWEYTNPGGLVWKRNGLGTVTGWELVESPGFTGPDATGQMLVPENIKKARFNLYLVLGDGSYGVHNPFLAIDLLDAGLDFVFEELDNNN